ncbi:MAG: hypothetical protein FWG17_03395 [Desulfovibrionaceae bacterium]|nr:hypothetical protein [Desulfovibrionaceae bacterium]
MLKRTFFTYSLPGFILAAALLPAVLWLFWNAKIPWDSWNIDVYIDTLYFWAFEEGTTMPRSLASAALAIAAGWLWAARAPLPDTLFARWLPLVLPPLLPFPAYIPRILDHGPVVYHEALFV